MIAYKAACSNPGGDEADWRNNKTSAASYIFSNHDYRLYMCDPARNIYPCASGVIRSRYMDAVSGGAVYGYLCRMRYWARRA